MNPLYFALIGCGYFGQHHLRLLQSRKDVELVAVATQSKKTLERIQATLTHPIILTTDASRIMQDPSIDCIVIATPASTHFLLSEQAIKANKHLLLEKPLTTTLAQARDLSTLIKNSSYTFMVGHQYIYNHYVQILRQQLNQNTIGNVRYVIAQHFSSGPIREDIGCFLDAGTHYLSLLQDLFNPGKIITCSGTSVDLQKRGYDDSASVTIQFEQGLVATIHTNWFSPTKIRTFTLFGNKGIALFDEMNQYEKLQIFTCNYPFELKEQKKISLQNVYLEMQQEPQEPLEKQLDHFIQCVQRKETPRTNISASLHVMEWADTISQNMNKIALKEWS